MVQMIVIRPGSTDYDEQGRIQGNLDVPLNDLGAAEVLRIIDELRERNFAIDTLYAPSCEPALQTAEAIAEALELKLRKLDRMQNLNHGLWQGMLIEDVRLKQPKVYRQWQEQPEHVRPPEGEMLSQAEERVQASVSKLLKRHKGGIFALVCPEPLASLVRWFAVGGELGDLWKATLEQHGRWEILEVKPEAVVSG